MSADRSPLELRLRAPRSTLIFAPSFHGYHEFARVVREIAPTVDAVAVELSDDLARGASRLLRSCAPRAWDRLPGPLAVARIAPAAGDPTPPLTYVPLISTDSICEALRGALDYSLPAYGIDLDRAAPSADRLAGGELLPDPTGLATHADLADYVRPLLGMARPFRRCVTPDFDARNTQMASRLLDLAARHRRLLVVIGMAHYPELLRLLGTRAVKPLGNANAPGLGPVHPIVLCPEIAARHMDRWPHVVELYDQARSRTPSDQALRLRPLQDLLRHSVRSALRASEDPERIGLAHRPPSVRQRLAFEHLLIARGTIAGQQVQTLDGILGVAQATCPPLVALLAEELMRYPWLQPEDSPYPHLSLVSPESARGTIVRLGDREYRPSDTDGLVPAPGVEPVRRRRRRTGSVRLRTWPPEDVIATQVALRLVDLRRLSEETESVPFRDALSLENGIDIRGTVRGAARGDRCPLAVRVSDPTPTPEPFEDWPFPVVYLFSADSTQGRWISWHAPLDDAGNARSGEYYHGVVGWGERLDKPAGITEYRWSCVIHFTPLVWGRPELYEQHPRGLWQQWLDAGHRGEMPIGSSDIERVYRRLGLASGPTRAHDLVRLAMRHCKGRLSLVANASALREQVVREVISGTGVQCSVFDAGLLPRRQLDRIRSAHLVEWEYEDDVLWQGGQAAPGIEGQMRESQQAHAELNLGALGFPVTP